MHKITDDENTRSFRDAKRALAASEEHPVDLPPFGGFVLVLTTAQ